MTLEEVEEEFGISAKYWQDLEEGRRIQSRSLDNYMRLMGDLDALPSVSCRSMAPKSYKVS